MNKLTPYLNEISTLLHSADRPEVTLLQRYEVTPKEQKVNFILSLIGKLIEQDIMLRARSGGGVTWKKHASFCVMNKYEKT